MLICSAQQIGGSAAQFSVSKLSGNNVIFGMAMAVERDIHSLMQMSGADSYFIES